jgi:membrane-bound ClpP family serine protease
MSDKNKRRLDRQFDMIERMAPPARRVLEFLRRPGVRLIRIPLGFLLVVGGIFSFLPVLGIWMLPLGLLLLAIDLPFLRPPVTWSIVQGRRKWATWRRSRRRKP